VLPLLLLLLLWHLALAAVPQAINIAVLARQPWIRCQRWQLLQCEHAQHLASRAETLLLSLLLQLLVVCQLLASPEQHAMCQCCCGACRHLCSARSLAAAGGWQQVTAAAKCCCQQ
jgi:hypothetical protein